MQWVQHLISLYVACTVYGWGVLHPPATQNGEPCFISIWYQDEEVGHLGLAAGWSQIPLVGSRTPISRGPSWNLFLFPQLHLLCYILRRACRMPCWMQMFLATFMRYTLFCLLLLLLPPVHLASNGNGASRRALLHSCQTEHSQLLTLLPSPTLS